ncbi:MAG: SUF system NifU family Fe-S cluster assembly protein [Phycisphaeraceae bacterium]
MIGELNELYQELLLDHSKRPRNFHELNGTNHQAEGYNPLCGDRISVYLKLADGRVSDASFTGTACAICTASASMMTEKIKGLDDAAVQQLFDVFHDLMTGQAEPESVAERLGKLAALSGVQRFPIRVKCATLPWHTMKAALQQPGQTISTE